MRLSFDRLSPAEWPALAPFIVQCNRAPDGGVRCLHAANGPDVASHAAELASLPPGEAAFWAIRDGEALAAVVGCEFDRSLRRAWVRGPLAIGQRVLDDIVQLVGPVLERALPDIVWFDAFAAAGDESLNAWYAAAGYVPLQRHTVLRASIDALPAAPAAVRRAALHDLPAAVALHQALFESAYIGEADFVRAVDADDRVLFVAIDAAESVGYLYVHDEPAADREACIDYLGVSAAHRGRGLGRALLDAATRWGAERGCKHLALTVREDRRTALALYLGRGFVEVSAGRHWRRTRAA